MRYYFDDPIQALWMMKEFGVKFTETDTSILYSLINNRGNLCLSNDIFYISPESEHIFEPKNNDVGFLIQTGMTKIYNYLGCKWLNNWLKEGDKPQIIMRDNKHFFNPKKEE